MKIAILGGTGLIGGSLRQYFISNHDVECTGREAFVSFETLMATVQDCDLVIQLSGANISKRWTSIYEKEIWSSRIETTELLARVVDKLPQKPKVICASAVGFYPESDCGHALDETCEIPGNDFLANLSVAWESAARSIPSDTAIIRFGVVLSTKSGALKQMYLPYFLGFGGPICGGNHCFSWVHIKDLNRAIKFIIDGEKFSGVYNLTSPEPISQRYFGQTLAKTLRRPFLLPLFDWQLRLIFGRGSKVLTQSISVIPKRLQDEGFVFHFPDIKSALAELISNK